MPSDEQSADQPTRIDAPANRNRNRTTWIVVAALVVVAIIVAIVIGIGSSSPGPVVPGDPSSSASASASPSATGEVEPSEAPGEVSPSPSSTGQPPANVAPIESPAQPLPGIEVKIANLEAVEGTAQAPGEIAGPAVRFTVSVNNGSDTALSLQTIVVSLDYGADRIPALELSQPGGSPLAGPVAPGGTATGTYIFNVPPDQRDLVRITVDYAVDTAPSVFEGSAPR